MGLIVNDGPAAVLYPLGTMQQESFPQAHNSTTTTSSAMDTSLDTKMDCDEQIIGVSTHMQIPSLQQQQQFQAQSMNGLADPTRSQDSHKSCWRPLGTDGRAIFTNPSKKRGRDGDDEDVMLEQQRQQQHQHQQQQRLNSIPSLSVQPPQQPTNHATNGSNDARIPPHKRVVVNAINSSHHLNTHATTTTTQNGTQAPTLTTSHAHAATITEPLIPSDLGVPIESPHFTESRITYALGISWHYLPVRPGDIGGDLDFVAAVRGWERYIEKHYPGVIGRARVFLERKGGGGDLTEGLGSHAGGRRDESLYLVAATPPSARMAGERARAQNEFALRFAEGNDYSHFPSTNNFNDYARFLSAKEDDEDEIAYWVFSGDLSRARVVGL
ncbi:hypothetical protein KEM55_001771, partial [Ascosphaera atra]